jgi:cytidine deaminase
MNGNDFAIDLIEAAKEASRKAYAPYSHIGVGAALATASGKVFKGSNIENSSYSLTICAERVALFKAIYDGERVFKALAVYSEEILPVPCGACLQALSEFFGGDELVYIASGDRLLMKKFKELLPESFKIKTNE